MTTVYLARHGESDWNASNRFQGHTDRPLTDRGREQAAALAASFADTTLEAVYSSPLERAFETARIVAAAKKLEAIPVADLREVDVGGWAGLARDEVEARFPDAFRRWLEGGDGWEDGETYEQMGTRVLDAIARLAESHPAGSILVVSHGGPIRAVHARAAGMDVNAYRRTRRVEPNAGLSAVAVEDGNITRIH
jgi:broad specificity phosphatase PhoE